MFRALLLLLLPLSVFAQNDSIPFPGMLQVDSLGKAIICLHSDFVGVVYLQEFKWNKWLAVDSVRRGNANEDTCYTRNIRINYSPIQFRLKTKGYKGSIVSKIDRRDIDSCSHFDGRCRSGKIGFICEQDWEIYDQYGNFVMKGHSKSIDVSGLKAGGYFINFGNTTSEFFKSE